MKQVPVRNIIILNPDFPWSQSRNLYLKKIIAKKIQHYYNYNIYTMIYGNEFLKILIQISSRNLYWKHNWMAL